MEWKPEYSVGIDEIDSQHKILLNHFSTIEKHIRNNDGWSGVHFAIVNLRLFAERHFFAEETLMAIFGYPGAKDHTEAHQNFFQRLDEIEQKALREDATPELLHFLRYWLLEHIMESDRGYGRLISQHLPRAA